MENTKQELKCKEK